MTATGRLMRLTTNSHDLYKNGDPDIPDSLLDRNGDVCLDQCKNCGKAESELSDRCPVPSEEMITHLRDRTITGHWFSFKRGMWVKHGNEMARRIEYSGLTYVGSLTEVQMKTLDQIINDLIENKDKGSLG